MVTDNSTTRLGGVPQGAEGTIPCLSEAAAAKNLLQTEGWEACSGGRAAYEGARPQQPDAGPGEWPHGWQFHATRTRNLHYHDRVLLPALQPSSRALLRSQGQCRSTRVRGMSRPASECWS